MTKTTQATQMGIFLPNLSATNPANTAPQSAPPEVKDVTSSCSLEDNSWPKAVPTLTSTEEMYPVS